MSSGLTSIPSNQDFLVDIPAEQLPGLSTQYYKLQKISQQDLEASIHQIGQGGFGAVYKARLFGFQEVAVKKLYKTSAEETDQSIRDKLKHELFMLGWLSHPCIVTLIGVLVPDENEEAQLEQDYGIVMEYAQKGSLHNVLHDREVTLPLRRRLNIVLNACQAMQFLHRFNVEHRDLSIHKVDSRRCVR
eukprot:TRINITY_DN12166_c1_g1_i10.p3 TRINITY_DN12166_c1_g1~~TRINITY_DN12166_c1_g1_i10.p3  ORF type:complete len:189 (+),score=21.97 TRINITY_DN12166_c1_g1_i10:231-797(+)